MARGIDSTLLIKKQEAVNVVPAFGNTAADAATAAASAAAPDATYAAASAYASDAAAAYVSERKRQTQHIQLLLNTYK